MFKLITDRGVREAAGAAADAFVEELDAGLARLIR